MNESLIHRGEGRIRVDIGSQYGTRCLTWSSPRTRNASEQVKKSSFRFHKSRRRASYASKSGCDTSRRLTFSSPRTSSLLSL